METVRVAIAGFGTIGSGVAEVFERQKLLITARTGKTFEIAYILDVRDFSAHPMKDRFVKSVNDIIADDSVSVVAEAIGGINPAFDIVMKCLNAGKHVVTSNKELVAAKGAEILETAFRNGVGFLFEAAVGGTMPIISSMAGVLSASAVERIDGILNGTTNFMLTNMYKKNLSFAEALERAQGLGYAETADPSADIDGLDAQRKIAILASLAYGVRFPAERVRTEGIRNVSREDMLLADCAGGTLKLIASAEGSAYGRISAAVLPTFVSKESRFAAVDDVFNMVSLKCDMAGTVEIYGRGAGKLPTAGVMAGDIIELSARTVSRPVFWTESQREYETDNWESRYFVTVSSEDGQLLEDFVSKVEGCETLDGAACFFTGKMGRAEAEKFRSSLLKAGFGAKLFRVLED